MLITIIEIPKREFRYKNKSGIFSLFIQLKVDSTLYISRANKERECNWVPILI